MKPDEVNQTCLGCHDKGRQANWGGGAHERRGLSCVSCHSVHDFHSTKAQLKTARDSETCFSLPRADPSQGDARLAPPGARGRDGMRELPRSARRHEAEDDLGRIRQREVLLLPHREAWARSSGSTPRSARTASPATTPTARTTRSCSPPGSPTSASAATSTPGIRARLYDGTNTLAGRSVSNRAVEHACKNCHQNVHGGNAPSGPYLGR